MSDPPFCLPTFTLALDLSTCAVIGAEIVRHLPKYMNNDPSPVDAWLTTEEAAQHLSIARSEVHRLAAAGVLPSEQDGGPGSKRYFRRSELDEWRMSGGRQRR